MCLLFEFETATDRKYLQSAANIDSCFSCFTLALLHCVKYPRTPMSLQDALSSGTLFLREQLWRKIVVRQCCFLVMSTSQQRPSTVIPVLNYLFCNRIPVRDFNISADFVCTLFYVLSIFFIFHR